MHSPLITIGITCFNAESTIQRAVISALDQDWPNTEIFIVDDASTDNSWKLLQKISSQSPKVKIIRHEVNKGYAHNLNLIIDAAHGEFISFFDDDDESDKKRISAQWKRITEYERDNDCNLIFCYTNRNVVLMGQNKIDHVANAIGRSAPEPHSTVVADYLFGFCDNQHFVWGMFGSCTMMVRRDSLIKIGGFDKRFRRCAEWEMAIRAAFAGAYFIAVDEPLITQYKTLTEDKASKIPLTYALLLRQKHKKYLCQRRSYLYSLIYAYAKFYYARKNRLRFRLAIFLSLLLKPRIILRQWIVAKRVQHNTD